MLASELPYEILASIGRYLPTKECNEYTTVCKSWTLPFQEALWGSLSINSLSKVEYICNSSSQQQNIFKTHGHLVYELKLKCYFSITHHQLSVLQHNFQNLRHLQMQCKMLQTVKLEDMAYWNLWGSIETLSVQQPKPFIANGLDGLVKILSFFPRLRQLSISEYTSFRKMTYTWKDIETISLCFPRLDKLEMNIQFDAIPDEEVTHVKNVIPTNSITTLCADTRYTNPQWLYYFALKVPNITSMELNVEYHNNGRPEDWAKASTMLSTLRPFGHLREIILKKCVFREGSPALILLKMFHSLRVPLKAIYCNMDCGMGGARGTRNMIDICAKSFSESLESLTIERDIRLNFQCTTPITLSIYPRLTKLSLLKFDVCIALDVILDQCISLEDLSLDLPCVSASQADSPTHGLRTISLFNSKVHSGLFGYLSSRCRNLSFMTLENVKIFGKVRKDTGSLYCEMPYTSLEVLHMHGVQYYLLDDSKDLHDSLQCRRHTNNFDETKAILINLMVIEQTGGGSLDGCTPNTPKQSWFHTYLGNSAEPKAMIRALGKTEQGYAKRYLESFPHTRQLFLGRSNIRRGYYGWEPRRLWRKDLVRGYTTWKCNSVGKFDAKAFDEKQALEQQLKPFSCIDLTSLKIPNL
ncbi:hypothetical protein CLU79DRAFT_768746 [Phycomyces nitens]|nr:hypothetical protein CLU79DRAFT_768746 [Phycomyces nitens]